MRPVFPLLVALSLVGCTVEDGRGFAHLSGKLWAHFDSGGRLQADGWLKADNSFELKVNRLELEVLAVELHSVQTDGAGTCKFDPANPPAGCTLCHGGHCHCGDDLTSYEDLEAQVCGGGTGSKVSTVGALVVEKSLSLLQSGTRQELSVCRSSCELPAGEVSQARATMGRLHFEAKIRDRSLQDRLGGKEPLVSVDWDLAGAGLEATLTPAELVDRDNPYRLDLLLEIPVTEKLLDGIDWHTLDGSDKAITIDAKTNVKSGEALATNLAETTVKASAQRTED